MIRPDLISDLDVSAAETNRNYHRPAMSFRTYGRLHGHEELTLALPDDPLHRLSLDRRRHDDRQRRAALDPERPGLLPVRPRVGDQRLPDRVRRPPSARGSPGRPVRPQARLP